jgi:hypothetical protein
MSTKVANNPFRPGPGLYPKYLAGRTQEHQEFSKMVDQSPVMQNLLITGLRGIGKTSLLNSLKPLAISKGWFWVGNDLSESVSISETNLAIRIITDMSIIVSGFTLKEEEIPKVGYAAETQRSDIKLTFETLISIFNHTPGLNQDKLKRVFEVVWNTVGTKAKGIILAYDEAQELTDEAVKGQYPLSLLLEVVKYLQQKEIPYLLILTGLPNLFPLLVKTRTYSERMFHVMTLTKLTDAECKEAIEKPIKEDGCPVTFSDGGISEIIKYSGGYPFFIQFFCKEAFDSYIQQQHAGIAPPLIDMSEIVKKLDNDFYAGRWMRITDRQKMALQVIAKLPNANKDFTAHDILETTDVFGSPSNLNQILGQLMDKGFLFKENHGKYVFAVPMLADFINRQEELTY